MEETSKEGPVSYSVEEWTLSGEEYQAKTGRKRPERHNRNPEVLIDNIVSWIILNAEAMTPAEHKSVQLGITVMLVVTTGCFATVFILKSPPGVAGQDVDLYWIRHSAILILNVIFASLCLALLLPETVRILRGWIICHSLVAKGVYFWAHKRKRITLFALLRQVAQTINVCAWLIQNAYLLGKGCAWFDLFPSYLTLVQWSCFNFSYVLDLVYADCLNPWLTADGRPQHDLPGVTKGLKYSSDPMLMDEPPLRALWRHAPKFLLGVVFEGAIVFFAVYLGVAGGVSSKSINDTNRSFQSQPQCSEQPYICKKTAAYTVVTSLLLALVVLHAILCFFYIEQAQDRLRTAGPYCQWERAHKLLGLLQQTCGWLTTLGLLSATGLLPTYTSCSGFVIAWFGVLPLQLTATVAAAVNAHVFYPRIPKAGDVVVQAWLRELAWTQEDVAGLRATMAAKLPALKERLKQEPIFCFDVAAKLLLWSDLVYTYEQKEAEGEEPSPAVLHASGWCDCWASCCVAKEAGEANPGPAVPSSGQIAAVHPPGSDQAAQPQQRSEAAVGKQNGSLHVSQAPPERQAASERPAEQVMEGSPAVDASDAQLPGTRPPVAAIQSFRLAPDGTLTHQQTDTKVKAEEEVASGDELDLALRLFGLTNFEILEEHTLQTKVLLGWSSTCIVLAFRGTAHAINVLNDIKVWRMPHPPLRGSYWLRSRPMVHGGFLQSWMANGLQARVLALMREIVAQASVSSSDFKVYLTGHSLGGALATLAAMDIGRELHLPGITCHTFGAPRTGSHAFAREYEQRVPNTWSIINDKDAVPSIGKIGWLYKRPGQRVLLNRYGDIRVRPDMFQVSLGQGGFSVREHYLSAYRTAFKSILKAQLMPLRGMHGGEAAVRAFAADRHMNALCKYLGVDLRRLLQTPQEKITITVKRRAFGLNPFSRYGFVNGLSIMGCRMVAFVFGEAFSYNFKALMHRFFPKAEDSDVSETEVPLDWSRSSEASDLATTTISSIP